MNSSQLYDAWESLSDTLHDEKLDESINLEIARVDSQVKVAFEIYSELNSIIKRQNKIIETLGGISNKKDPREKLLEAKIKAENQYYTERQLRIADAQRYQMAINLIREMKSKGMEEIPDFDLPPMPEPLEFK
ncbi:hypothetical protein FUA23_16480 [Neolewinella aurantiaca]|uniref:Uncharacterized protein n=1 Tax=Neolewinella aurantiaca TaxID=2602767 RepID=A0A5C7FEX6_9BACT|nr:hypothetical protein [Neolewinella aurantiaca]TXF88076.1 hypothetical protein FUA23_16480 [Neolewinella aurantiaca]